MRNGPGKREYAINLNRGSCLQAIRMMFGLAVLGALMLTGCGGSGGGSGTSPATPEQVDGIRLSLPCLITYRDASGSTIIKTIALDVSFSDDGPKITAVMQERSSASESLTPVLSRTVVLDYTGRMLSEHITDLIHTGGESHYKYTYSDDSGAIVQRRYSIDAKGIATLVDTCATTTSTDGTTVMESAFAGDINSQLVQLIISTYSNDRLVNRTIDFMDGLEKAIETYSYNDQGYIKHYALFTYDTDNNDWPSAPDSTDSWSYTYDTTADMITDIQYNRGNDATIDEYIHIDWKSYTAPTMAASFKGQDFETLMCLFEVSDI